MSTRMAVTGKAGMGMCLSALCACGGGMGGYSSAPMSAAPTASFTAPAQAAALSFGQALVLKWSSANATSCTASVSAAAGGGFTGTQATSGSLTVVPSAAGTYTYTLMCTGSGGNISASTPTVSVGPSILAALSMGGKITTIGSSVDPSTAIRIPTDSQSLRSPRA